MEENRKRGALSVNMTEGSLWKNMLLFSLPLMMTQVLEVLFNLSDVAIAGKYAYNTYVALGSVGSTTTLVTLFTGLLIGLGGGVNVAVARGLGMGNDEDVEHTTHSSFLICLAMGVLTCLVCVFFAEPMLRLLHTKEEFLPGAVLYLKLYALGLPAMGIYNCGNGILSATGDTKRPLLYLTVAGVLLLICALAALPDAIYWLPEALTEGGSYWTWLVEDSMPMLMSLTGGIGCLFGANHIRTTRRMRKKIDNIVGDAKYMYIQDIADAIPCSYEKCCKHLENCIDEGLFGPGAYLDMHRKCLVVKERPPEPTPAPAPAPKPQKADPMPEADQYQKILDELRRVNDAIPDEEMTDKISRLEAVSAKIFEQARTDPDKLPQMRKFMDYYLPTSLKLLNTYAELDKQGIEGENISESKHRIEQTMDTLVKAFENQLDRLFASDALDVSTDIDVMQNMLRADGLTDDTPFKL